MAVWSSNWTVWSRYVIIRYRPAHIPKPGSGWEMMLQFANTLLADRMLFASSWMTLGLSPKQVVDEFNTLPIRDSVRPMWMGENAARLLGLQASR